MPTAVENVFRGNTHTIIINWDTPSDHGLLPAVQHGDPGNTANIELASDGNTFTLNFTINAVGDVNGHHGFDLLL